MQRFECQNCGKLLSFFSCRPDIEVLIGEPTIENLVSEIIFATEIKCTNCKTFNILMVKGARLPDSHIVYQAKQH